MAEDLERDDETNPKAFLRFSAPMGALVERLATAEGRKVGNMAKRLIAEALSARGLWNLEGDCPVAPVNSPPTLVPSSEHPPPKPRAPSGAFDRKTGSRR